MRFVPLLLSIVIAAIVLFSNVQQVSGNMREWPVPPFPPGVLRGEFSGNAGDYIEPWKNYLIYLGIVIVTPIIYLIILFIINCCTCCFRCCTCCPCSPLHCLERKNLSGSRIRLQSIIPYAIGYVILAGFTIISIGFFVWLLIGWVSFRSVVIRQGKDLLDLPNEVLSGVDDLNTLVPDIIDQFGDIVARIADIESLVTTFETDTQAQTNDARSSLLSLNAEFTLIRGPIGTQLESPPGTPNPQFVALEANMDTTYDATITALDDGVSALASQLGNVQSAQSQIQNTIDQMGDRVDQLLGTLRGQIDTFLNQGREFYEKYITEERLSSIDTYFKIGEAVIGVICILILCICVAVMTCGFLCICVRLWPCLICLQCCSCGFMIIYGILGAILLTFFFLASDVCQQGEEYIAKTETALELPPIKFTPPGGSEITIRFSTALLGVLHCEEGTYLDATGLTLEDLGVYDRINQVKTPILNQLNSLDALMGPINDMLNEVQAPTLQLFRTLAINVNADVQALSPPQIAAWNAYHANHLLFISELEDFFEPVQDLQVSLSDHIDTSKANTNAFVDDSIETFIGRIEDLSVLQCNRVGDFYSTSKRAVCTNVLVSSGGISISFLLMVLGLTLLIALLLHAECLSRRLKRDLEIDEFVLEK